MDFHHILTVASEKQGVSAVPKRYSLAVGPPKKDPKVKGVHSAAVQAFLKRQEEEQKRKVLEEKKRKEELLAKRVELKHDRKARAMASRTKDNFCGYNGIPMEEKPKKRQGRGSSSDGNTEGGEYVTRDEREEFEYSQTESENEMEEYEEKPPKSSVKPKTPLRGPPPVMNFQDLLKLAEKKQHEPVEIKVAKKAEERPMTAEELREREYLERKNKKGGVLKEKKAEKELKNVIAPSSSKKDNPQKEFINAKLSKLPTDRNSLSKGSLSSQGGTEKKAKGSVLSEKHTRLSSSKLNHTEKVKPVHKGPLKSPSNSSHIKPAANGSGKSGLSSHPHPALKTSADMILRQPSVKEPVLKKASGHIKPAPLAQEGVKLPIAKQASSSSAAGGQLTRTKSSLSSGPGRPNSSVAGHSLQDLRPGQSGNSSGLGQRNSGSNIGPGRPGSSPAAGSGRPGSSPAVGSGRPGSSPAVGSGRSGSSPAVGSGRPGSSPAVGSGRPGSSPAVGSGRPGSSLAVGSGRLGSSPAVGSGRPGSSPAVGSGRPGSSGPARPTSSQSLGPGRPGSSLNSGLGRGSSSGSGPGHPSSTLVRIAKPKCTVVSETISSKNLGPKQGSASVNGMRPFPQQRSGVPPQGFPRPSLPPITYKRQFDDDDDDEYDSEMEDFIDDEEGPEEEISKHIKEIFGYDRNRYKDESDYALRYMESSWKEQQKEEAKSLRLGIKEDLEELKREEEELKRKKQAKKLRTH